MSKLLRARGELPCKHYRQAETKMKGKGRQEQPLREENLVKATDAALAFAEGIPPGCGSVVEVLWIDQSDVL